MKKKIDFYFDFISPYSYFAWLRMHDFLKDYDVEFSYKPVLLAGLLNHWGQKGPAEIEPKRLALFRTCLRYAAKNNIDFTVPKFHPFNPLYVLRLALKEVSGDLQFKVIDTLWKAGWEKGIDMGEPDQITQILKDADLPAEELLEKTFERDIKKQLKDNTKEAIERGAFGLPGFYLNEEMFWGNDSLEDIKQVLQGRDFLDKQKYEMLVAKTASAARQSL